MLRLLGCAMAIGAAFPVSSIGQPCLDVPPAAPSSSRGSMTLRYHRQGELRAEFPIRWEHVLGDGFEFLHFESGENTMVAIQPPGDRQVHYYVRGMPMIEELASSSLSWDLRGMTPIGFAWKLRRAMEVAKAGRQESQCSTTSDGGGVWEFWPPGSALQQHEQAVTRRVDYLRRFRFSPGGESDMVAYDVGDADEIIEELILAPIGTLAELPSRITGKSFGPGSSLLFEFSMTVEDHQHGPQDWEALKDGKLRRLLPTLMQTGHGRVNPWLPFKREDYEGYLGPIRSPDPVLGGQAPRFAVPQRAGIGRAQQVLLGGGILLIIAGLFLRFRTKSS